MERGTRNPEPKKIICRVDPSNIQPSPSPSSARPPILEGLCLKGAVIYSQRPVILDENVIELPLLEDLCLKGAAILVLENLDLVEYLYLF